MLVLVGEADVISAARLDEALTTQASGHGVWLTFDATNLRCVDSAWMRTLVVAAMAITAWDGTVTLLNPQPPAARLLDLLCVDGMISARGDAAGEAQPAASADGG